jgi:hypothetical protein
MGFKNLAKKLDRITESKHIRDAAMALVSHKKDSPEFQKAYAAMTAAYSKFNPLGIHFNIIRVDGRMVYSNENTLEQIKAMTDNHGMKPEVNHTIQALIGYNFDKFAQDSKIKFKSGTKILLTKGYGVSTRYGFNSGKLEIFVAKAVSGTGVYPSAYECIARVSQIGK